MRSAGTTFVLDEKNFFQIFENKNETIKKKIILKILMLAPKLSPLDKSPPRLSQD